MKPGTMYVSGVAVDGVREIILRYPRRAPVRDVHLPVRSNVYAAVVRGRPELAPAVYAAGRNGIQLVQRGQQPPSRRQHALDQRSSARDLNATSRPSVVPPVGYPHTTFTFRVRLKPLHGYVYVLRVTGPSGLCHDTVKPVRREPRAIGSTRWADQAWDRLRPARSPQDVPRPLSRDDQHRPQRADRARGSRKALRFRGAYASARRLTVVTRSPAQAT